MTRCGQGHLAAVGALSGSLKSSLSGRRWCDRPDFLATAPDGARNMMASPRLPLTERGKQGVGGGELGGERGKGCWKERVKTGTLHL